ncbi:DUF2784 family protein [Bacteroidota bacterium]
MKIEIRHSILGVRYSIYIFTPMFLYKLIDLFFVIFHTSLIIFNVFGWIWKKTRKANLIILSLTAASWFILGIFYGIGYCPLTDWHFNVLYKLGKYNLPNSYTKYLADRLTGFDFNPNLVDRVVLLVFLVALFISLLLNFKGLTLKLFRKF